MRAVVQRVKRARVTVTGETVGEIGRGLVVLLGVGHGDGLHEADWLAGKVAGLRVFPDDEGRMNRDVRQVQGAVLSVSQFTLWGDASKGRRPSFIQAAAPEVAEPLWARFNQTLEGHGILVQTGRFRADMDVEMVNWGPVTLWLENPAGAD